MLNRFIIVGVSLFCIVIAVTSDTTQTNCLAPESLINTKQGLIRIDSLNPTKHAIYYHTRTNSVEFTNNYSVKKVSFSKNWRVVELKGGNHIKMTPDHAVAVIKLNGPDLYHYRPAGVVLKLNSLVFLNDKSNDIVSKNAQGITWLRLKEDVECWDIQNNADCWLDESNFFVDGLLVHGTKFKK